jgi:hypothetical protein
VGIEDTTINLIYLGVCLLLPCVPHLVFIVIQCWSVGACNVRTMSYQYDVYLNQLYQNIGFAFYFQLDLFLDMNCGQNEGNNRSPWRI